MGNKGEIPYEEMGNGAQPAGPLTLTRGLGRPLVTQQKDLEDAVGLGWGVLTLPSPPFLDRLVQSYIRGCAAELQAPGVHILSSW